MATLGIICVDDEGVVLEGLKEQLRRSLPSEQNCLIEVADTGEEALEIIQELQDDNIDVALVISDQIMPGMKGDELLVEIHSRYPDILKILLTGQANTEAVGHAVNEANLYRYMTKPWDEMDLALTVTEALRRYRQELKLAEQNQTLRRVNRELAELNISLEDKVKDRTLALEQANVQLQEAKSAAESANHSKSAFLASMSHALRTPLNAILGFSQILCKDPTLGADQQGQLTIINRSGEHLLHLINDVLEMSKIEAGKMTLNVDTVQLPDLLDDLRGMLGLKADAKGIGLTVGRAAAVPDYVEADPYKLRQVLINLLGNAVKFTDSGTVTYRVQALTTDPADTARLRFEIQDTGVGMTPEQTTQICQPFEQVGDQNRQQEGTGLGLSISTQIIRLMDSQLEIESTPNVGSTFSFEATVPVAQEWAKVTHLSNGEVIGYEGDRRTILVIDDRWENRSVLHSLLMPLGFDVIEAADGQQGYEQAELARPHLIITDLNMPVLDGLTLIRQLREQPDFKQTPIVVSSASVFDADQHSSLDAGANAFLPKPVRSQELLTTLATQLDLAWRYTVEDNPPTTAQPEGNAWKTPPADVLCGLIQRLDKGDLDGTAQAAQQLDSDYSAFTQQVVDMAENFQVKPLRALLQKALEQQNTSSL